MRRKKRRYPPVVRGQGGPPARVTRKRIDLGKVRAARKRLENIAKEHPELLGESSPENLKGWESTRQEMEMGKTTLVAFRLDNELLKRIDAFPGKKRASPTRLSSFGQRQGQQKLSDVLTSSARSSTASRPR